MMRWIYKIPLRLRSLFWKDRVERELSEELRFHLEKLIEENVAKGMAPEEARYAAMREIGGVEQIKEECRDMRRVNYIESLLQDLRYGLRQLRRNPGFTAVAVITLALGIGANTAIFSVIDGVMLRPLPYPHPQQLVRLTWGGGSRSRDLYAAQFQFYRDHGAAFQAVGAYRWLKTLKLETGKGSEWVQSLQVTSGFLPTLGINPVLGRNFLSEETRHGGPEAVILTNELWRNVFGSDRSAIGRQVRLGGESYTVVGVLPSGFKFVEPVQALIPLRFTGTGADLGFNTSAIGRVKPGISLSQAQADMAVLDKRYDTVHGPGPHEGGMVLVSLGKWLAGDLRPILLILFGAVALLLLIACANVAGLLLARSAARQKEVAVRLALGAGRGRLVRQFFAESLLLALSGGAAGLLGAIWILHALMRSIPWDLPATDRIGLDFRVLLFTLLVAVVASAAFGFASLFQVSKLNLNAHLKEGWGSATGEGARSGLRKVIVAAQLALSLTLLVGAGLLIESLYNLYGQSTGFNPHNLITMETPYEPQRAASTASVGTFERAVLQQVQAIPGVKAAAVVNNLPLAGHQFNIPVQLAGHPKQSIGDVQYRTISPAYFTTMGIPLLRGRMFTDIDTAASQPVVIINESLARQWWGNRNPLGNRIVVGMYQGQVIPGFNDAPREVVGIVGNVRALSLDSPMLPTIYVPATQVPNAITRAVLPAAAWVVRTRGPGSFALALRRAVAKVDSAQRVEAVQPMTEVIGASVSRPRFNSLLLGIFAALALVLTAIGLYGLISYSVSQRTHEIGVRIALGAQKGDVLRLVVGEGMILTLIGVGIGIAGALGATRLLSTLLYGVKPADPLTFFVASLVLSGVAVLASYIPAKRATKIDPMVALRYE